MLADNKYLVEHERALIEQAIDGDQQAFSQLFFTYKEMVYKIVYRLLGASEDTHDAVQQTFIELFKSLPGYEGKSKFTTWLYRIAVNVSIQFLRKRKPGMVCDSLDPEILPDSATGKDNLEHKEIQYQVTLALQSIHVRKRVVVILHDMEERTMEEIAEIVGVPLGTIKSRLFHGREELRKKLRRLMEQV